MLSHGDSVRAKWADEWCLGRFWSEVSETRGCYEIRWDNGEQNAIPAADVQRFEQRFKCCHAHHPDFRKAVGVFEDYECVVTDHDASLKTSVFLNTTLTFSSRTVAAPLEDCSMRRTLAEPRWRFIFSSRVMSSSSVSATVGTEKVSSSTATGSSSWACFLAFLAFLSFLPARSIVFTGNGPNGLA